MRLFLCLGTLTHWFHASIFVPRYDRVGTIHDFFVSMLCGLDHPVMSVQNATAWGYFDAAAKVSNTLIASFERLAIQRVLWWLSIYPITAWTLLTRKLGWIFMHPKPYLRFWIFEIKYYNNIRANFLSYFNVNVYFITIIHYLNN